MLGVHLRYLFLHNPGTQDTRSIAELGFETRQIDSQAGFNYSILLSDKP